MKRYPIIALGAVFAVATACRKESTESAPAAPPSVDRVAVARAALQPLKKDLKEALMKAVAETGAVGAVGVCNLEAGKITESASREGIRVGRSALKLRNPKNAPEPWLAPALLALSKEPQREGLHRTVDLPDGALGYVEPIYTGGLCLTCHGAALAPEVAAAIDAAYPADEARGFEADAFRGVFWAVVPPR